MRPLAALLVAIAVAAAAPVPALAQQSGAGVSGGSIFEGVEIAFVREHMRLTRGRSTRLVAAILWRATPGWSSTATKAEGARVQELMDSASAAAQARGNVAGGVITPRGAAWVEYDLDSRTVMLPGRRLATPEGDSALVVLLDRVDGGAPPAGAVLLRIPVAHHPQPTLESDSAASGWESVWGALRGNGC